MTDIRAAMVMAAGLGTRIRALADDRPKPMVAVAGRPLIDYALDEVAAGGAARAVVNVHWMPEQIEAHLAWRTRPEVVISDERAQLMDTGGGLVQAAALLGDGPVFCTNTDAIIAKAGAGARALAAAWDDAAMDALLLCVPLERTTGFHGAGDFALGADGRLSWEGADKLAYTGLQVISPRLFAHRPAAPQSMRLFWDEAMAAGRMRGVRYDGAWHHVGDPEGHAAAEAALSSEGAA